MKLSEIKKLAGLKEGWDEDDDRIDDDEYHNQPDTTMRLIDRTEEALNEAIYAASAAVRFARNDSNSGQVAGQIEAYLIPWLRNFIEDRNQPGSIASLRRMIERE